MQITVREAAKILHRSEQRVRAYIHESDPKAKLNLESAVKKHGQWYLDKLEVEELRSSIKQRKDKRRKDKRTKHLQEKRKNLKGVLRIVQLDNSVARELREQFLRYLHEKLNETDEKLTALQG